MQGLSLKNILTWLLILAVILVAKFALETFFSFDYMSKDGIVVAFAALLKGSDPFLR
jgi:hypothetical protein